MLTVEDRQFRVYSPEEGVAIIRAVAEHRWPMTINEAFALRDQFNWKPAPDNGRFFTTAVSNGEEDGYIGYDVRNSDLVSRFNINLTTRLSQDTPRVRTDNPFNLLLLCQCTKYSVQRRKFENS